MAHESDKELDAVLIGMVGRRLTVGEIIDALELSPTTYYQQKKEGRLTSPENLVTAARNLGINEVELLLLYGVIDARAIDRYYTERGSPFATAIRKGVVTRPSPDNRVRVDSSSL